MQFHSRNRELDSSLVTQINKERNYFLVNKVQVLRREKSPMFVMRGTTTGSPRSLSRAKLILNGLPNNACNENTMSASSSSAQL